MFNGSGRETGNQEAPLSVLVYSESSRAATHQRAPSMLNARADTLFPISMNEEKVRPPSTLLRIVPNIGQ